MTTNPVPPVRRYRIRQILAAAAICGLGFNLRPTSASIGPVLAELHTALQMSPISTGMLTSLPVLTFAVFGAVAPYLARALNMHRLTLMALLSVVTGLVLRSVVNDPASFLLLSLLALSGIATANVLLPPLIKLHFPHRVGLLTSAYTAALAIGATTTAALTVPIADQFGSWRWGIAVWAFTALIATVPWLALARRDATVTTGASSASLTRVGRTRLGWGMAATFALQSTQAYSIFGWSAQLFRDTGFSPQEAGLLLGIVTAVGIPVSFTVTYLAGRTSNHGQMLTGLVCCYFMGYLGLLLDPSKAWIWVVLVGAGTSIFPLVLAQIGLRARTPEGTAALSGFTQAVGYLLATPGPFIVGLLYNLTGGWTMPLLLLMTINIALAAVVRLVAREQYIEDQLAHTSPRSRPWNAEADSRGPTPRQSSNQQH